MASLAEEIDQFLSEARQPILFAGAGVSARAGLPVWSAYLSSLAEALRPFDPLVANVMQETLREGDFLRAASFHFLSSKLREVDKLKNLTAPRGSLKDKDVDCNHPGDLGKAPLGAEGSGSKIREHDFTGKTIFNNIILDRIFSRRLIDNSPVAVIYTKDDIIDGHSAIFKDEFLGFLTRYLAFAEGKRFLWRAWDRQQENQQDQQEMQEQALLP